MTTIIGVTLSERMLVGLVVDHKLAGPLRRFPENEDDQYALVEMPTDSLIETICERVVATAEGSKEITAVGVALPGIIKQGVIEDSPNLPQLKGARVQELLTSQLRSHGLNVAVNVLNDADAVASGLAASIGKLDHTIRVWSMGVGIGYGRYPFMPSTGEGGHTVVTLDDKERFCGCGGRGHMEGIMGHRAMRLRFLDMEPDEVFAAAKAGDVKCVEFKKLWHKALAAGTASSIHTDGPGKFFMTGFNVRFVDLAMLKDYVQQMVTMSPLQSYTLEVVSDDADTRVIGAAVAAQQASMR